MRSVSGFLTAPMLLLCLLPTASSGSDAAPAKPQLPYTGLNAIFPAAGGALLLGSGLALRKRVRD